MTPDSNPTTFTISLQNIGRRFNREWIFRQVSYVFETGKSYAVLGANGSGKSTLLQIISGSLTPSEGNLNYQQGGKTLEIESAHQYLSLAAPYLELIEEFSLEEQIDFHFKFKRFREGINLEKVIEILGFQKSRFKAIRYFSSGMKQRTKLVLAFCSDTPVLLLDEPTSNLDIEGVEWYLKLVEEFSKDRLVIICSNQEQEYQFCDAKIEMRDYK